MVEGHFIGRIEGFKFIPDITDNNVAKRALVSASHNALRSELVVRAKELINESDLKNIIFEIKKKKLQE